MSKMKIIFNKITFAALLAGGLLGGCEKGLDVDPAQSIDASGALNTKEEITASIVGIYSPLKSPRLYGRDIIALPEALGDNGYVNSRSGRFLNEYNNVFGAHFTETIWTASYAAINQINLTLEAIPKLQVVPGPTAAEIALWEGQLYFLRGLYYFELMKAYAYTPGATVPSQERGGVVVSLKGYNNLAEAQTAQPARQSIDSVYKVIATDFRRSETRLLASTTERSLATKGAAQSMLSRVYLYAKNYDSARFWATTAITGLGVGRMTDVSDYISQWRSADNKETIFQVKFTLNSENIGVNESLQTSFTTLTAPGVLAITGGFGDLVPSLTLLNDLGIELNTGQSATGFTGTPAAIVSRTADVRNLLYEVGTTGRGAKSYVETTKYLGKNGFLNLDNVPVIRMSELYLNRAEAFATPGSPILDLAAALADLKVVKSRRYLNYSTTIEPLDNALILNPTALYEEILRQRRLELAFEGQRFHDLKRLGRNIVKSPPSGATIQFTDARILAPILQADVDGNPNLRQNFGY